eukprot:5619867-Amphidinium_carterae.2
MPQHVCDQPVRSQLQQPKRARRHWLQRVENQSLASSIASSAVAAEGGSRLLACHQGRLLTTAAKTRCSDKPRMTLYTHPCRYY